jgi:hypothetical protein
MSLQLWRERVLVGWRQTVLLPRLWLLIGWLFIRQRSIHRRAIAALFKALKAQSATPSPLRALEPGLFEVEPWFLRGRDAPDGEDAGAHDLTVVHLLGTGENIYSPLTGLRLLCRSDERLCAVRHVIVDTPHDAAGYLGPLEFATRLRRVLAPLLARESERLVIVGLSRGAMAALDLGADLASTQGMRVGVLAMAPPMARPKRPPHSVLNIGGFEPIMENFIPYLELHPWLWPLGRRIARDLYVRFCGFTLAELRMVSDHSIAMFARYVTASDPTLACLRAVREFALLGRVSDAELRHATSMAMQQYAFSETAHVTVCWGQDDAWLEVPPCRERLEAMIARHGVPAERIDVHVLSGVSHGVSREPTQDFEPIAAWLVRACEHARGGQREQSYGFKMESA